MWRVATPAQRFALAKDLVQSVEGCGSWAAFAAADQGTELFEALSLTLEAGDAAALQLLLPGVAALSQRDFHTLLNEAACFGRFEVLEALLGARSPVLLQSSDSAPPAGEDEGSLALHQAASSGHARCVMVLLRRGYPLEGRDRLGRTPLWLAVSGQQTEAALVLLKAGADVRVADRLKRFMWDVEVAQRVPSSRAEAGDCFVAPAGPRGDDDALALLRVLLVGPSLPTEAAADAHVYSARVASTSMSRTSVSRPPQSSGSVHAQPRPLSSSAEEPHASSRRSSTEHPVAAAVVNDNVSRTNEDAPSQEEAKQPDAEEEAPEVAADSEGTEEGEEAAADSDGAEESEEPVQHATDTMPLLAPPPVAAPVPAPAPPPAVLDFGGIPAYCVWLDRLRDGLAGHLSGSSGGAPTPAEAFALLDVAGSGSVTPAQLLSRCQQLKLSPAALAVVIEAGGETDAEAEALVVRQAVAAATGQPLDAPADALALDAAAFEQLF